MVTILYNGILKLQPDTLLLLINDEHIGGDFETLCLNFETQQNGVSKMGSDVTAHMEKWM